MAEDASPAARPRGFDDDRPVHTEPGQLPPEVLSPLAPFEGREPDAPDWFKWALGQTPERQFVTSLGSKIELLTWGEVGKPGLLFVHGNSAHADWWSFIAPFLANDYRVASMSLAGMGASDWRETYAFQDFAEDAEACARAAGLYEGGRKPTYIGHSFGGSQVYFAAARHPDRMHAAVLVDTGFGGPPPEAAVLVDTGFGGPPPEAQAEMRRKFERVRNIPTGDKVGRVYPDMTSALKRFRFMPPQPVGQLYIADFIARRSLKEVRGEDGQVGYTWRFDPAMWVKLDRTLMEQMQKEGRPLNIGVPMAHIYGDKSQILDRQRPSQHSQFPPGMIEIAIPDSEHHIMVDQPLALVAALRALLAAWPA